MPLSMPVVIPRRTRDICKTETECLNSDSRGSKTTTLCMLEQGYSSKMTSPGQKTVLGSTAVAGVGLWRS